MYLTNISIYGVFLFQRNACRHTFEWYHHYFRRPLAVIKYFQGYSVFFKQALAVISFFKGIELILSAVAAIHSINYSFSIVKE